MRADCHVPDGRGEGFRPRPGVPARRDRMRDLGRTYRARRMGHRAEEAPEVIREIKDRSSSSVKPGVTPDKAEDVAAHLYEIAYGTATRQKDRFLTRAELLRVFHARTHVSMPAATYNALLAIIPQHLEHWERMTAPQAVGGARGGRPRPAFAVTLLRQRGRSGRHRTAVGRPSNPGPAGRDRRGKVHRRRRSCGGVHVKLGLGRSARRPRPRSVLLDRVVAELAAESGLTHVVLEISSCRRIRGRWRRP